MHPSEVIQLLKTDPEYREQIASVYHLEGRSAVYDRLGAPLPDRLLQILQNLQITKLYSHQVKAINLAREKKHFVIATSTASGKSLAYNLPVLETILSEPEKSALYIFPTKALAHDQWNKLHSYGLPVKIETYDGDTRAGMRAALRNSKIILTNPDMLHTGILPNHLGWHHFFSNLSYIVLDEIHCYRGIFGIHMAHLLRRLRRVCTYYGSTPTFIFCSATIDNPREHAERLSGLPVELVADEGAPSGDKYLVFWNPYKKNSNELINRSQYLQDATWLLGKLAQWGKRCIVFTKSRQLTEWLWVYLQAHLDQELMEKIRTYRGGYLPDQRREIESLLFEGTLQGIISTNALELGIDIGTLEAAIIVGFPGTVSSFWQQAGRAGRNKEPSMVFYISTNDLLDLYYLHHAGEILRRRYGQLFFDVDNPYILLDHIQCAAFEIPLSRSDTELWGSMFEGLVNFLMEEGDLTFNQFTGQWFFNGEGHPARKVNLRSIRSDQYLLVLEDGKIIGTIDGANAFSQVHPQAVYLHQGQAYEVISLDIDKKIARLKPTEPGYFTEASETINVEITTVHGEKPIQDGKLCLGEIEVISQVTGFRRKTSQGGVVEAKHTLFLPEERLATISFWLTIPPALSEEVKKAGLDLHGGLHGLEHVLIGLMPLLIVCDRWDLAGTSMVFHPQTGAPSVFVFDAVQGGVGLTEKGWERFDLLLAKALETVENCSCSSGCPSCIQSPKCGNWNQPLDKEATLMMLRYLENSKK